MNGHALVRWVLLLVFLFCWSIGHAAETGIETRSMHPNEGGSDNPAVLVHWLNWSSGFRESGIEVGDKVIGTNLGLYTKDTDARRIGLSLEIKYWEEAGLSAGDDVTLVVERGGQRIEFTAKLIASNPPEIPTEIYRDTSAFSGWTFWYQKFISELTPGLGFDPLVNSQTRTREMLARLEAAGPDSHLSRIEYLKANHPGPFTESVVQDFEKARDFYAGEHRELTKDDLEYRSLGEIRAKQIAEAAIIARAAFEKEIESTLHPKAYPVPKFDTRELGDAAGMVVLTKGVTQRDILFESEIEDDKWVYRSGTTQDFYLVPSTDKAVRIAQDAIARYSALVTPEFEYRNAEFHFYGRILPEPIMKFDIRTSRVYIGPSVQVIAAFVKDQRGANRSLFIDLREENRSFAGESELRAISVPEVTEQSTPQEALYSFFEFLKVSDFESWMEALDSWYIVKSVNPNQLVPQSISVSNVLSHWQASRQKVLSDIYAIEPYYTGQIEVVYEGDSIDGDPTRSSVVEEVIVGVRAVGLFDGEYRTFFGPYKTSWRMQRVDGGIWKVAEDHPRL